VEFSPFDGTRLAVSTAQNFGIIGQGKQYVLTTRGGSLSEVTSFETKDGCYDCTWSESVEHHLAFCCGDGR
jgi:peroxin-7